MYNTAKGLVQNFLEHKKVLFFSFKVSVSVGLIILILRMIDLPSLLSIFAKADYKILIMAFSLQFLAMFINSIKVVTVFNILDLKLPVIVANCMALIEIFYSLFLPGHIAGDIAKGVKVFPLFSRKTDIFVAIFIDRIVGLIGLLTAFISAYFIAGQSGSFPQAGTLLILSVGILALFMGFLIFGYHIRTFLQLGNRLGIIPLKMHKILISHEYWNYLAKLRTNYPSLGRGIFFSTACYYVIYLSSLYVCLALDIKISFALLAWIVSLSTLIVILPVSVSGLGVREGATIYFMSLQGISSENSLAFAAIGLGMVVLMGLLGGILNMLNFAKLQGYLQNSKIP